MRKYYNIAACIIGMLLSASSFAGNRIKIYFNHPVDTTVATDVKAVYSTHIADTIVAYIGRAKYTIDVAVYNFVYSASYANIAGAIDSAYNRGVRIRWIYDGSSSNTGLANVNPAINTLASPTSAGYGIMHNKFMVIDAYSPDPNDAIVYTGSMNWTAQQINTDYNNVLFLQDSALARAYKQEFDMMWGDTSLVPNAANSKFGPDKTDLGLHNFNIDGHDVKLYFSPSDNTNSQILNTINTANTDLYFGLYTFTYQADANAIMNRKNAGVYVAGIDDAFSDSYSPYNTFTSGLGSNFISYHGTGIYHNKFMIVDPSDKCSDPIVETGSHNWSTAANTQNDENVVIIHSDTVANIYYQSFMKNFTTFGGSLIPQLGCGLSTKSLQANTGDLKVYPNPFNTESIIAYTLSGAADVTITVSDLYGKKVASLAGNVSQQAGLHTLNFPDVPAGVYFVSYQAGNDAYTVKVVKLD
ncbi:MAG: T9SS type A sorting domain-containing protein [Bacteroidetes bacterium]|nr:T9SS type A sorting domain-containing protein [Bacteroidota bacterium]